MTQRVTRQYVSVLGPGSGKLRVTRQYAYVLLSLTSPTVFDSFSVNDVATFTLLAGPRVVTDSLSCNETVVYELVSGSTKVVNDSFSLNGVATSELWHPRTVTDSLAFNDTVATANMVWNRSVNDSMSLTDGVSIVKLGDVTEDLTFDETVIHLHVPNDFNPTGDSLTFNEVVVAEKPTARYVYDSFSFTEVATGYNATRWGVVAQNLFFNGTATGYNPNIRQTINDVLTLVDLISRTRTYTISDTLTFTGSASHLIISVTDSLTFNETVAFGRYQALVDSMTLYGVVEYHADFLRSVVESLAIGHSLAYYLIRPCTNKQYTPFVGESTVSGIPDAPSITLPVAVNSNSTERFQMSFPATGEFTDTVTLPAPEFENRDRLNFTRISRETRGGKLSVFADPNWPKINTVVCNFTGLTSNEVYVLQTFIETHLGEEINITDWEGREWIGVITTPNEPATHDGKNKWSVGFEFEGVIVEYIVPGNNLTLNETVSYVVV
jgi:hypothetical protein